MASRNGEWMVLPRCTILLQRPHPQAVLRERQYRLLYAAYALPNGYDDKID